MRGLIMALLAGRFGGDAEAAMRAHARTKAPAKTTAKTV
jgi:hypothetical protein